MRLIIIDLTNNLLTDEESEAPRRGAGEMLRSLARRYRLAAFADTARSGPEVRSRLHDVGLGAFFQTVTTSADLGAPLSVSAVRHMAAIAGAPAGHVAVISNNLPVVDSLQLAGVVAVPAERNRPVTDLPEALAWMIAINSE